MVKRPLAAPLASPVPENGSTIVPERPPSVHAQTSTPLKLSEPFGWITRSICSTTDPERSPPCGLRGGAISLRRCLPFRPRPRSASLVTVEGDVNASDACVHVTIEPRRTRNVLARLRLTMRRRSGRPALARRGRRRRPRPHQRREHAPETRGQNDRQEQHGQPELDERDSVQGRERRLAEHKIGRGPQNRDRAYPDHLREPVKDSDDNAAPEEHDRDR